MKRYELFHDTGGHGGPFIGLKDAENAAKKLLKGSATLSRVSIVGYEEWSKHINNPVPIKVYRKCPSCGSIRKV